LLLTVAAFAVNAAVVEPAAMTTDDGIVTLDEEPMPVITVRPWLGAGADVVTVHVAEPGVMIVAGEQVTAVTLYRGVRVTRPPVAVTVTEPALSVAPLLLIT
jgi:hypothetical protein